MCEGDDEVFSQITSQMISLVSTCGFFLFLSSLFGPSACCGSSEKNKCDLKYCPTLSLDYFQLVRMDGNKKTRTDFVQRPVVARKIQE